MLYLVYKSIPETIAFLSQYVELFPGDLIMMGTPDGVGPLVPGDEVEGWIEGINTIRFTVTEAKHQTPSKL